MNGFRKLLYKIPSNLVTIETLVKEANLSNDILANMKKGGLKHIPIFKEKIEIILQQTLSKIDFSKIKGIVIAQSVPFKIDLKLERKIPITTISGQPCAITHLGIELANEWQKNIKQDILLVAIDKPLSIDKRLYFNSAMGDIILVGVLSNKNVKHKILSSYVDSYIFADNGEYSDIQDINRFRENNPLLIRENIINNLKKIDLELNDIDYIFPHTPYLQIWDIMAKVLNYPREQIFTKYIDKTGHLNSNDSFFHYLKAIENGIITKGNKVLLVNNGFGGSRGSTIIEYIGGQK